ncbi:MAG: hypothetical protein HKP58_02925 [Desulfatitalea sp.]|nr:hypothetical protein [Desulfatitalea sp.]NNJ99344.1 hypothetical protein [Desulfatitalea sp.]
MVRALFRWFKAVGFLLTGQIDSARQVLDTNPHVVRAKYDEILREKTDRIHQYKQAVAGLIAQQETKIVKVKGLTEEVQRLEDLKAGALAKAKQRVTQLQAEQAGKERIQHDEAYMKCLSAYNDFNSTLAEKQARIDELEADIAGYGSRIKEHKVQLQQLLREIEKLKSEASDAVAEIITARQEKEMADAFTGIAEDGTEKELQRMRELRQQVKAEARISSELAGTDTRKQEAEFLDYARKTAASDEFEALVGLAADHAAPASAQKVDEKGPALPE